MMRTEVQNMDISTSRFLRRVLGIDAATCVMSGLLMMFAATPLSEFMGIPAGVLFYSGISLLPFAAFVAYLASRETLWRSAVWAVIVLNVFWTVDSFMLIATASVPPTELGYSFI